MGISPGSSIANLYLGFYELKFMTDLAKHAIEMAHASSHSPARAPVVGQVGSADASYTDILSGMRGMGRYIDDFAVHQ